MARQIKKAAAGRAQAKKAEETQTLRIALEPTDDVPSYYINHVEVSHSRHDFGLGCAHLPTTLPAKVRDEVKRSGVLSLEPLIRLIVPPTLIPALIRALQAQQSKYEDRFGEIKDEIQEEK